MIISNGVLLRITNINHKTKCNLRLDVLIDGGIVHFYTTYTPYVIVKITDSSMEKSYDKLVNDLSLESSSTNLRSGSASAKNLNPSLSFPMYKKLKIRSSLDGYHIKILETDLKTNAMYNDRSYITLQYLKEKNLQYFSTIQIHHYGNIIKDITTTKDEVDYSVEMRVMTFDIETTKVHNARDQIIQIGYTEGLMSLNGEYQSFRSGCFHHDPELSSKGTYCQNELAMVDAFETHMLDYNPVLLIGHNMKNFDLPKINLVKPISTGDAILIDTCLLWGTHDPFESQKSLGNLAMKYGGGVTKEDVSYDELARYWDLPVSRRLDVLNYCIRDTEVLFPIIKTSFFLSGLIENVRLTNLIFGKTFHLTEMFSHIFFKNFGEEIACDFPIFDEDQYEGGLWIAFTKSFIKQGLIEVDATGMYQNIIIINNISPETIVDEDIHNIGNEHVNEFKIDNKDYSHYFLKPNTHQGWLPRYQSFLKNLRVEQKDKVVHYKKIKDFQMMELYKVKEKQTKLTGNIFTGILKTKKMVPLIETITSQGRKGIRKVKDLIEGRITSANDSVVGWCEDYDEMKEGTKQIGYTDYIATDGLYFELSPLLSISNESILSVINTLNSNLVDISMKFEGYYPLVLAREGKKNTFIHSISDDGFKSMISTKPSYTNPAIDGFLKKLNKIYDLKVDLTTSVVLVHKGNSIESSKNYCKVQKVLNNTFIQVLFKTSLDDTKYTDQWVQLLNIIEKSFYDPNFTPVDFAISGKGKDGQSITGKNVHTTSPPKIHYILSQLEGVKTFGRVEFVYINEPNERILKYLTEILHHPRDYWIKKKYSFIYTENIVNWDGLYSINRQKYIDQIVSYNTEYFKNVIRCKKCQMVCIPKKNLKLSKELKVSKNPFFCGTCIKG